MSRPATGRTAKRFHKKGFAFRSLSAMKIIPLSASAFSLLLLAGTAYAAPPDQPGHVSPAPGTNSDTASAIKDSTAGVVGKVSAEMTHTTKGFVAAAAASDMYEVEAGKIAAQRASSQSVKDFANHMVEAHTQTTDKLKSILASNNISATPPAHLDDRRQGMIDDLRGAKVADFDHRYLAQQQAAHEEARILMRGYAKDGDNPSVKQFASDTLPAVKDHLAMVRKIAAELKMASK
jgi:putative membrane protein